MLLDNNDQVIEQVIFTSLSFPESTDDADFKTAVGAEYQWKKVDNKMPEHEGEGSDHIQFKQLPVGFHKIAESMRPMRMDENPVRHAIVSDGVASVSIYVEYTSGKGKDFSKMEGTSSMGATHAYTKMLEDALITVVGEVPEATVIMVGNSVILSK